MFAFLAIASAMLISTGRYLQLLAPAWMLVGICLTLHLCRMMGAREIPQIQEGFEKLVRIIERNKSKYTEMKQSPSVLD